MPKCSDNCGMSRSVRGIAWRACLAFLLFVPASAARAESSAEDKGLASLLFQQGRALLLEGKIPEACQKLGESQRLDPSGGTLLNLALCHEREGRLASSWSEFREAAYIARRDGRPDREVEATTHVGALAPRLSRLTIVVSPAVQVAGLRIERNGHEVGRGAWSTAIPVDGGEHIVRATATGREPFNVTLAIGAESDARTIEIPALATAIVPPPPAVALPREAEQAPLMSPTTRRRVGIGTAGAGVLLLAAGGWALAAALNAKDESSVDCTGDVCGPLGRQKRSEAVSRGDLATILGISGAVLVGGGVALYYFGRRGGAPRRETTPTALRVSFGAAPGVAMTAIEGRF